jgi:flagellar biosynthesis/type III secretory pathway chaperone
MTSNYIDSLESSLVVKSKNLDKLIAFSEEQKEIVSQEDIDWDKFDKLVDQKSAIIDELTKLDSGFDIVYNKIKADMEANKDAYKPHIKKMQELIKEVTEKSTGLMAIEQRNKNIIEQAFAKEKKLIASNKMSNKIAVGYYNNMNKINFIDPQLMDKKK